MRIIKAILIFYQRLIVPALFLSGLLSLLGGAVSGGFSFQALGFSYIITAPLFHYFIYEIGNSNEYYFYYNMGLSRLVLWIATLALSIIIGLIFILI